ncbi:MAG: NAD-dependent epimerase/dehydratase family protein [Oscillochloris sp.]|nr:NAD-dependent epimerase/dehydratase family protein [Oscillochloris sp.]
MAYYLIAGASGYVGSRLAARLLAQGQRVRGLVRSPEGALVEALAARGMSVWTGDVTRADTLVGVADGVDYVLNLTSGLVIDNGSVRRTFVDGNQNLIAACSRSRSVRSYVFTSNVSAYGDAGDALIDEDAPVSPACALGAVMAAAERTIMDAAREHHFPAIILRVAPIYGPERDPIAAVEDGTLTIYGDGRNFVPHIHVDDLVEILARVPAEGQPGAIYNVGDDEPMRQYDLVAEVRRRLGMVPPRTFSPAVALQSGIDESVVATLTASTRLSNARLKHDLGLQLRYPSYQHWLDERLAVSQETAIGA